MHEEHQTEPLPGIHHLGNQKRSQLVVNPPPSRLESRQRINSTPQRTVPNGLKAYYSVSDDIHPLNVGKISHRFADRWSAATQKSKHLGI